MNTKRTLLIAAVSLASASFASGATSMVKFWAYDQNASNSPNYSHYQVTTADHEDTVGTIDLYDSGWGNHNPGNSSFHYMASVEATYANTGVTRSVGWHQYAMIWNDSTMTMTLTVDGGTVRSGSYADEPTFFRFVFHNSGGGIRETVIDDFQYWIDGSLAYQQGFDSPTLDSSWTTTRIDGGTYVTSGDTTTPRTGVGSLALGSASGVGGAASIIVFDLASVPEPSVATLGLLGAGLLARRRPIQKMK